MRYIYIIFFYLALPFILLRLLWRSRHNVEYRRRWQERLGFPPFQLEQSIWVHSTSVGETLAAIPLVKKLQANYPAVPIVITTMTVTGSARVKAAFGESVFHSYVPYDVPCMIRLFLKRIHPLLFITMETELWPNLFSACRKRNIPVLVANARLSEKSAGGYQRIGPIIRELFSAIKILAVQSQSDADRFIALGMPKEQIYITGNLKFDLELPVNLLSESQKLRAQLGERRLIWIAASTHQGEEEIILATQHIIRKKIPNALLILVPRHPERFDLVATMAEQQGFKIIRRSNRADCSAEVDIFMGDTMGEMSLMFSVVDVAFVAGSLMPIGGHNILEPGVLGKPIITGPQLFNFSEITQLFLAAQAMIVIQNAEELATEVIHLFEDTDYRKMMGNNAALVVAANRGALLKQVALVKLLVEKNVSSVAGVV